MAQSVSRGDFLMQNTLNQRGDRQFDAVTIDALAAKTDYAKAKAAWQAVIDATSSKLVVHTE